MKQEKTDRSHLSFKKYLESQGKSKSTIKHYNTYVLDFLSYLDRDHTEIEQVTAKEVLFYLGILQKRGLENKTRAIRLNVIKQFFGYLIDQNKRADNPVNHLKIRGSKKYKLHQILDKQELEGLYYHYLVPDENDQRKDRNWFSVYQLSKARNKTIISLMVNQGLTTTEIANLTVDDLHLKQGQIRITAGRRSNERTLELRSNQIMDLMEYQYTTRKELLKFQSKETQRLFLSAPTASRKMASDNLHIWKRLTEELKNQNKSFINFKQVRASLIVLWLKQYNLRQVQYMVGHRYVSSTESYLVNQTEDLLADIDLFHPV